MSEVDDLLDVTLDDLEDLPKFAPFPAGAYRCLISFLSETVNDKPCIKVSCKHTSTEELTDSTGDAPAEGDEQSTLCFLDNEFGRGNLKELAQPFREHFGYTTIRDVVEGVKEVDCLIVCGKPKKDREDPDRFYPNIKSIAVI